MDQASAEQTIQALQKELINCQRYNLLGSVAGLMAHEFNNLMTPVLARAQDAVERDDVAAMRKALTVTVNQTTKAIDVTRRLLELAGGAPGAARPCVLRSAVDDAIAAAVRPFPKDGIELTVGVPDELTVRAEPVLLAQVLLNLLLHARHNITERTGRIAIRAAADQSFARIEVADNGNGTPRERIENAIAPFLASDVHSNPCDLDGVGLDLNACRTIVQFHGGRMTARPATDTGCVIECCWPIA